MALWTPEYITTALWYNADGLSAGSLTQWDDLSGNAVHATEATNPPTVVAAELNGKAIVRFDGTNDRLAFAPGTLFSSIGKVEVFGVVRYRTAPTAAKYLVEWLVDSTPTGVFVGAGLTSGKYGVGGRRIDTDSFQAVASAASVVTTGFAIQEAFFEFENSDLFQRVNGEIDGSSTSFQTDGVSFPGASNGGGIGANAAGNVWSDIDVAEIVVTKGIDAATRQQIEGYLAHKWGLEGDLDAGHPYKSTAPQTLSLGNTATLAGTSPVEPVERVLIHRDNAGTLVLEAQIVPDASGVWEYPTLSTDDHYVTYLAATYPPLTHGPYTPA